MAKDLAIILNNGSINSAVTTAIAAQKYRPIMLWAELAPAQGAGSRQRAAYDMQVAHFKPYREHSIGMPWVNALQPHGQHGIAAAAASDPRLPATLGPQLVEMLPLLSAASRFAAHYGAAAIYTGLRIGGHGDELARATEYIQIWNEMLQLPCNQPELEVVTPLLELDAWQVIDIGFQVTTPFDRTWTCHEETSEPCWACRPCRARSRISTSGESGPDAGRSKALKRVLS